jgi:hypothetical protein
VVGDLELVAEVLINAVIGQVPDRRFHLSDYPTNRALTRTHLNTIFGHVRELVPVRIGTWIFFGFAFGLGGIGSVLLGKLTYIASINFVYHTCLFLSLVGILSAFLPNLNPPKTAATR